MNVENIIDKGIKIAKTGARVAGAAAFAYLAHPDMALAQGRISYAGYHDDHLPHTAQQSGLAPFAISGNPGMAREVTGGVIQYSDGQNSFTSNGDAEGDHAGYNMVVLGQANFSVLAWANANFAGDVPGVTTVDQADGLIDAGIADQRDPALQGGAPVTGHIHFAVVDGPSGKILEEGTSNPDGSKQISFRNVAVSAPTQPAPQNVPGISGADSNNHQSTQQFSPGSVSVEGPNTVIDGDVMVMEANGWNANFDGTARRGSITELFAPRQVAYPFGGSVTRNVDAAATGAQHAAAMQLKGCGPDANGQTGCGNGVKVSQER